MALRSLLRKAPALGGRSWPMGSVQKLSPAAGSRLFSAEGGQTMQSQGALAEQRESLELRRAEFNRKWEEQYRRTTAEFDKNMEMHLQQMASDEAYYGEVERRNSENLSCAIKELQTVRKICDVLIIAFPAAAILVTISANM